MADIKSSERARRDFLEHITHIAPWDKLTEAEQIAATMMVSLCKCSNNYERCYEQYRLVYSSYLVGLGFLIVVVRPNGGVSICENNDWRANT